MPELTHPHLLSPPLDFRLLRHLRAALDTERTALLGRFLNANLASASPASSLRVHWTRDPISGEPRATLVVATFTDDPQHQRRDVTDLLRSDPQAAPLLAELLEGATAQQAEPGILDVNLPQEGPGLTLHLSFTLADQPGMLPSPVQHLLRDTQVFDHVLVTGQNSPTRPPDAEPWAAPEFTLEIIDALQALHTLLQAHAQTPVP